MADFRNKSKPHSLIRNFSFNHRTDNPFRSGAYFPLVEWHPKISCARSLSQPNCCSYTKRYQWTELPDTATQWGPPSPTLTPILTRNICSILFCLGTTLSLQNCLRHSNVEQKKNHFIPWKKELDESEKSLDASSTSSFPFWLTWNLLV